MHLLTAFTGVSCTCDALTLSTPSGAIYPEYPGICFYSEADVLALFTQPVDAFCTNGLTSDRVSARDAAASKNFYSTAMIFKE